MHDSFAESHTGLGAVTLIGVRSRSESDAGEEDEDYDQGPVAIVFPVRLLMSAVVIGTCVAYELSPLVRLALSALTMPGHPSAGWLKGLQYWLGLALGHRAGQYLD